jgi:hypothetical protein
MPAYGDQFTQMLNDWNAQSLADRLASRGITQQDGQYFTGSGEDRTQLRFDGSQTGYPNIDAAGAFDPRSFVNQYHVLPLDSAQFNGNLAYNDASIAPQQRGNLDQWLNSVSGGQGGQIINDPTLGRVWVPNNPSAFDPWRDTSPQRSGSFIDNAVNGFADNGGVVAALGAGVGALGAGAGMAGGGAAGQSGGMFSNLPSWAGGAPEGLGGGAAGAGLGGASAPAIGTAAGAGADAAGGGMFSDLPGWAGGAGSTGAGGGTDILQQLQQLGVSPQQAAQIVQQMGGGGAGTQTGGGGQQSGLQSLLPFLGIGSGLNTLLGNRSNAVDPNMVNSLWQAGQNTYNTSLDPQNALYAQTAQRTQDQARAADSARGIGMGGVSAGNENDAMRKFNIDWQNNQLNRQAQGVQSFAQAGNVGANAGIANNAQAFMQNQTGLNNLTTGLQGLFGSGQGGTQGAAGGNAIGSWLNGLFSGGGQSGGGASYQPFNGAQSYNSQGTYQPYYTGYDSAGGPAYG